jgi:glutathione S-transferase
MEYLEERYPEPTLWPADAAERALGRLWLERFDDRLGDAYYALRRGGPRGTLDAKLAELDRALEAQPYLSGSDYGLADAGYVPWILRAIDRFELELGPALSDWLERLCARPAIAAEREVVAAL